MAKLPFGGHVDEPDVDLRADPSPLLAEVAACAYEGRPMPPRLAEWFYRVWKKGRFHVKEVRGTAGLDSREKRVELLMALREFEGKPGIETVILKLRKAIGIESDLKTIHGWRRELKAIHVAEIAALSAQQETAAVQTFRRLRMAGVSDAEALIQVKYALEPWHMPTEETIENWRWQSEHDPADGDVE